ncbi:MAG: hypothetical protein IJ689_06540 [Alphaproteobacteria bacterium]|nr:hypothetical protein [Alphaproteobacteria bacterium]
MKKILATICLAFFAIALNAQAIEKEITVSGVTFTVNPKGTVVKADVREITNAKWKYVFRLEETSDWYGDWCHCGTVDGKLYIASPDFSQQYLIDNSGLHEVTGKVNLDEDKGAWAEFPDIPLKGHRAKFVYGYVDDDKDPKVYVVVFGNR